MKKLIISLLVVSSMITVMPREVHAETVNNQEKTVGKQASTDEKGEWVSKWIGYTYQRWYKIGDSWATGWKKIDGNLHYFYSDGTPAEGTPDKGGSWKEIDGKWYSFESNGIMKTNSIIVDYPNEYYVGEDGIWTQMPTSGWIRKQNASGDDWRYREDNSWVTGWKKINENWYYFYPSGDMMTNCTKDGYRAGKDGICVPI